MVPKLLHAQSLARQRLPFHALTSLLCCESLANDMFWLIN